MKNSEKSRKTALEVIPKTENQQVIDNHKKTATHFEAAAKSHLAAAKHHENGNHESAEKCAMEANNHSSAANEVLKKGVNLHTAKF